MKKEVLNLILNFNHPKRSLSEVLVVKNLDHLEAQVKRNPKILLDHIRYGHLAPGLLEGAGLPRYDIELATVCQIPLDEVVTSLFSILRLSDNEIFQLMLHSRYTIDGNVISLRKYTSLLRQTLKYIDQLGITKHQIEFPGLPNEIIDVNTFLDLPYPRFNPVTLSSQNN